MTATPDGANTYDDNGNLVSAADGFATYQYDDENRLVSGPGSVLGFDNSQQHDPIKPNPTKSNQILSCEYGRANERLVCNHFMPHADVLHALSFYSGAAIMGKP